MLPSLRARGARLTTRQVVRSYSTPNDSPPRKFGQELSKTQNVSKTNETPTSSEGSFDQTLQESVAKAEQLRTMQAPNRRTVWSTTQQPRHLAMVGPRFEQTIMEDQPRPMAAIDLIQKQPVRWSEKHVVSCDGGGGPLGHPRIFINLDKPQINMCTYCGLPFANKHHRKTIEAQNYHPYPLDPQGDAAEVEESQQITSEPLAQR